MVIARVKADQHRSNSSTQDAFAGKDWPITKMAMTALLDLGLSNQLMARYFAVERKDVVALRNFYGPRRVPGK